MHILVIGSGGREHALCWKLAQSPRVTRLSCAPGNAGIAQLADCVPDVKATDIQGILAFARQQAVDFVVIGPDDPLALGLSDALAEAGIPAFGPTQAAARLESSKLFAKALMRRHHIPTAGYAAFDDCAAALAYLETHPGPIVVKADGLALGKGVVVADTTDQAIQAVRAMMLEERFGRAGARVVIEERMTGAEVTLLCLADGRTLLPLLPSQDHKRALDGDLGPNTGGMGAFAPSPLYTPEIADAVQQQILVPIQAALLAEGIDFRGVLYVGLMLTPAGPRVLEFNARFGDPEAQAILPLLQSDLLEALLAASEGRLTPGHLRWHPGAAACVVLASGGYPAQYQVGLPIHGLAEAQSAGALVFHAGTRRQGADIVTAGGRVLDVTATGDTLSAAVDTAYRAAGHIAFGGMFYRRDIGRQ
ncbi:MAG: phosphoribosylamine--glycine ligase [Oscillospiraceae bacterium]|nr:phosphoribosylamine--glycine ligase [Oscillospiraceae bacterium]